MDGRVPSALELPQRLAPVPSEDARGPGGRKQHLLGSAAAAQTLASVVRPCYGPHGRQKLLVTAQALAALPALAIRALGPLEDPSWALYSAINTHILSHADHLAKMVAHACWAAKDLDGSFKPERVGVCTLLGGTLADSCLLPGLATSGRLCGPLRKGSEKLIDSQVAQLAAAGINVAVVWGEVDEGTLALADKHRIVVVQVKTRREIVYLSEVLGTPVLPHLLPPRKPGRCQRVYSGELGGGLAVVFEWAGPHTPVLTLVLRGPTTDGLRQAEQAAYHGIDAYDQLCQDPRVLPGAGAVEMALARVLSDKGGGLEAPNGPAFLAFARALRVLPTTLAENAGLAVSDVMAEMSVFHQAGNFLMGVGDEGVINVAQEGVWDTLMAKVQGFQAAVEVVLQLVTVDEIIMAKDGLAHPGPPSADPGKASKNVPALRKKQGP
ncbi:T-complex protein 1 subunit theta-like 2 [Tupaia chinensis]|uniref:T-complex protein 1 subunit theta-like 2 n=1 Tax=Tupaia chinensis TaxID=246437 RepID=UPI0003C8EEF5|nr:T-complex protein 1 subunit theta-like 2 [Tupaia chinensis]